MPMYNLIEHNDNYSKTSGSIWKQKKDVTNNNNLTDSKLFKSKIKITGNTPADGNRKDVEIAVPSNYLSNFWRTLEMPLVNCKINLMLTRSSTCAITNSTGEGIFATIDAKLYVPVVTLSTQDNAKLLQKLKSGFKRTISWNKYQSKISTERQNQIFRFLN